MLTCDLLIGCVGGELTRGAYLCAGSHEPGVGLLICRVGGEPLGFKVHTCVPAVMSAAWVSLSAVWEVS